MEPATFKRTVPKPFFVIFNETCTANEDPTSKGLGTGGADVGSIHFLLNGPTGNLGSYSYSHLVTPDQGCADPLPFAIC